MIVDRTTTRRSLAVTAVSATAACVVLGVGAGAAHADSPPQGSCNPNITPYWATPDTAVVEPVVTYFLGVNITPGTTGQHTYSLKEEETVTTTIDNSPDFSFDVKIFFVNVGVKAGLKVQSTKSTTHSIDNTSSFNLNTPGHYGLYRGTRRVEGEWIKSICARKGPDSGIWLPASRDGKGVYTTFDYVEEGTVACGNPERPGTLAAAALKKLEC